MNTYTILSIDSSTALLSSNVCLYVFVVCFSCPSFSSSFQFVNVKSFFYHSHPLVLYIIRLIKRLDSARNSILSFSLLYSKNQHSDRQYNRIVCRFRCFEALTHLLPTNGRFSLLFSYNYSQVWPHFWAPHLHLHFIVSLLTHCQYFLPLFAFLCALINIIWCVCVLNMSTVCSARRPLISGQSEMKTVLLLTVSKWHPLLFLFFLFLAIS